jgi:uncharacterized coiled-coil protein SlyX
MHAAQLTHLTRPCAPSARSCLGARAWSYACCPMHVAVRASRLAAVRSWQVRAENLAMDQQREQLRLHQRFNSAASEAGSSAWSETQPPSGPPRGEGVDDKQMEARAAADSQPSWRFFPNMRRGPQPPKASAASASAVPPDDHVTALPLRLVNLPTGISSSDATGAPPSPLLQRIGDAAAVMGSIIAQWSGRSATADAPEQAEVEPSPRSAAAAPAQDGAGGELASSDGAVSGERIRAQSDSDSGGDDGPGSAAGLSTFEVGVSIDGSQSQHRQSSHHRPLNDSSSLRTLPSLSA